jgi:hypothetical protein
MNAAPTSTSPLPVAPATPTEDQSEFWDNMLTDDDSGGETFTCAQMNSLSLEFGVCFMTT